MRISMRVRVNVAANILPDYVIDRLMAVGELRGQGEGI